MRLKIILDFERKMCIIIYTMIKARTKAVLEV